MTSFVQTGMHVPIVRSFAMACLYTVAVLAGRRAISLRGLALAAMVLMLLEPQQVPGVSLQMSFSAVLALISGYEVLRPALRTLHGSGGWQRRFASHLAALALTSALAGTASAPFAAYHFGRIQIYFVIANMIAVPLTALWVMPAGLIALLLLPFGLDWLAYVPMGWGAEAILYVARTTAAWPAATLDVPHMPPWGLAVTGIGIAWLGLWRSRLRLTGVPVIMLGLASLLLMRPADLMVSADARLIGVRVRDAVYLQQESGASKFTRDAWLQYWATGAPVAMPADGAQVDGAIACREGVCLLRPVRNAKGALLVRGASHPAGCAEASVIVSRARARSVRTTMAGAGRSLHGVALRRDRYLARWAARDNRHGSRLSRRSALGAAAAFAACPRCTGATGSPAGQIMAAPGHRTISVKDMSARDIV